MKSKLLAPRSLILLITAVLIVVGCTKIDTTTIGSGLLPAVDNINTFDTTLEVVTKNYTNKASDSTYVFSSDAQILGHIDDPVFGRTTANLYFQVTPPTLPFVYSKVKDSLVLDSAVLVVRFSQLYGDSSAQQKINVYPVTDDTFKVVHYRTTDTIRKYFRLNEDVQYNSGQLLGSAFVSPAGVRSIRSLAYKKDKDSVVSNQLRIRLDDSFGQLFLNQDSNGAFKNEAAYRNFFKGFALVPDANAGGNALMYFLTNSDTRLNIYHRVKKADGSFDTTVQSFPFGVISGSTGITLSANANYVKRDRSSGEVAGHLDTDLPDDKIYLQGTPGTKSLVTIPGIENLSNRTVHRAELVFKQIWTGPQKVENDLFPAIYVYPEIFNTDSGKILGSPPFDSLIYNAALGSIYTSDFFYYVGGTPSFKLDNSGNGVEAYNINLTRLVQAIITRRYKNYPIQLTIPYRPVRFSYLTPTVAPYSPLGAGRLKAGGGGHPQYKMYLRIIYSKVH